MFLNRRRFLQLGAGGAVGLSLQPFSKYLGPIAYAQELNPHDPHFFVLVRMIGGWDVTLGLDPWLAPERPLETDMYIEYRPEDVIQATEQLFLGPAMAPLKAHGNDLAVINGIFMAELDNGHEASLAYATNTSKDGNAPNLPVELEVSTQATHFGVLSTNAVESSTRTINSALYSDLKNIPNEINPAQILRPLFSVFPSGTPFLDSIANLIKSAELTDAFSKTLLSFGKIEEAKDPQVLAAAFLTQTASHALYDLSQNLDTHAAHPKNHLEAQKANWEEINTLFNLFKSLPFGREGKSLFDHTTFMVVSEFSRTPALNAAQGKDHNPLTNSFLLAGKGVLGGKNYGASKLVTAKESPTGRSYHIVYPMDLTTGEVLRAREPRAKILYPEHIGQTLATILNVDRARFLSIPKEVPTLNWLIEDKA